MLIRAHLPVSYLFGSVKRDVFRVMLVSLTFHAIKHFDLLKLPQMPQPLSTILGTSISLLLAFNLNQSYERWWEARRVWGSIVNDSRTLVLQLQTFLAGREEGFVRRIALRQIAWCYSLASSLRGLPALPAVVEGLLSPEERAEAETHRNAPLALLQGHARDVAELAGKGVHPYQQVEVSATVSRLTDWMGMGERIKSTVFPTTYRVFVHLYIYLFLVILSLALVESIGFYEVPVLTIVATTFFLIEKTATHLQDPFSNLPTDTAMSAISRNIEINLRQLIRDPQVPQPLQPDGFYLM